MLIDNAFRICRTEGEDGFDYIADQGGLASVEAVQKLRSACDSHLARLRQQDIDATLEEWNKQRFEDAPEDYIKSKPVYGFVYLMKNLRNGHIKIGFSKDPKFRERTLQSEEPEVRLLRFWSGSMGDEQELHSRFSNKRLRGEWFSLTEEDVSTINPKNESAEDFANRLYEKNGRDLE